MSRRSSIKTRYSASRRSSLKVDNSKADNCKEEDSKQDSAKEDQIPNSPAMKAMYHSNPIVPTASIPSSSISSTSSICSVPAPPIISRLFSPRQDNTIEAKPFPKAKSVSDIKTLTDVNLPDVIVISGEIASGKDSLITIISKYLADVGVIVQHIRFSDNVKIVTSLLTSTSISDNFSNISKSYIHSDFGDTLETIQSQIENTLRDYLHPDVWILPVFNRCLSNARLNRESTDGKKIVTIVSDCKLKSELDALNMLTDAHSEPFKLERVKLATIRINRIPSSPPPSEGDAGKRKCNDDDELRTEDYQEFMCVITNPSSVRDLKLRAFAYLNFDI